MNRPTRLPTYVSAIALMTVDLTNVLRPEQAMSRFDHVQLAGAGVLAHRVRPDGSLSFSLKAVAAPAGIGEGRVADWLEDELAIGGLIAGYDLYRKALPLIRSVTVQGRHLDLAVLAVADKLRSNDPALRKSYVRLLVDRVEVSTRGIRITGSKAALEHAVLSPHALSTRVPNFDREWCRLGDSNT